MKTNNTTTLQIAQEQEIDTMSKRDMLLIKATIALFAIVLNICCFQLFF